MDPVSRVVALTKAKLDREEAEKRRLAEEAEKKRQDEFKRL